MGDLSENFSSVEFLCPCCKAGEGAMSPLLIGICQQLRQTIGLPIRVTSGFRCEKHNAEVKGVKGSYHTTGEAADLYISIGAGVIWGAAKALYYGGELRYLKYCLLYKERNIVHIDLGEKPRNRIFEVSES